MSVPAERCLQCACKKDLAAPCYIWLAVRLGMVQRQSKTASLYRNQVPDLEELSFTPLFLVSASSPARQRMSLSALRQLTSPSARPLPALHDARSLDVLPIMHSHLPMFCTMAPCSERQASSSSVCGSQLRRVTGQPAGPEPDCLPPALAGIGDSGSDETSAAAASFEYVPGAGDDEESWARGLTPQVHISSLRSFSRLGTV